MFLFFYYSELHVLHVYSELHDLWKYHIVQYTIL